MRTFELPTQRLRDFSGTGTLANTTGLTCEGGFEIMQAPSGALLGVFYGHDDAAQKLYSESRARVGRPFLMHELQGQTIQGWEVSSSAVRLTGMSGGSTGSLVVMAAGELDVTHYIVPSDMLDKQLLRARFALLNLNTTANTVDLDLDDGHISIDMAEDHASLLRSLKTHHNFEITGHAEIDLESIDASEEAEDLMTDVCILLSLATGTRVNWVNYDVLFLSDEPCRTGLTETITHPFSDPKPLIPLDGHSIAAFVRTTLPAYRARKTSEKLHPLINLYMMAKIPHLYIESRIQLICQALEALKDSLCDEYMIEESVIDESLSQLKRGTRALWAEALPDVNDRSWVLDTISGPGRVKGMARTSFGRALKEVVDRSDFQAQTSAELRDRVDRLVSVRDRITHRALTYPAAGDNPGQDFAEFVNLFDMVMMRALGYQGPYHDISDGYEMKQLD